MQLVVLVAHCDFGVARKRWIEITVEGLGKVLTAGQDTSWDVVVVAIMTARQVGWGCRWVY